MLLTSNNKGKEAFDTMVDTKKRFCKEEGRQGYHFKLSFSEKDPITPNLALEITARFCEEIFPDNECIYAVHDNTTYLFDGILLQSPLFELMGFYELSKKKIEQYINELLGILNDKDSNLFYTHVRGAFI